MRDTLLLKLFIICVTITCYSDSLAQSSLFEVQDTSGSNIFEVQDIGEAGINGTTPHVHL